MKIRKLYGIQVERLSPGVMSKASPAVVIGTERPVFSWKLSGGSQRACRVKVASAPALLENPDIWDSGWCESRNSLSVVYAGKALHSRQHLFFQVAVEFDDGQRSQSETADFFMALLNADDWCARWIYADGFEHHAPSPAPMFRRTFSLDAPVREAKLFSSAKGLLEVTINGKRIDEHDFLPGWSDFRQEAQYTAYDVTDFLHEGKNCIGALLGDGWYVTSFPGYRRNLYGTVPMMLLQLELLLDDGSRVIITSDEQWRWEYGPILASDIYDGENYNANREDDGWTRCDFDDSAWKNAQVCPSSKHPDINLVWRRMPGVCKLEVLPAVSRNVLQDGVCIYDFGRVITGRVRMRYTAPAMTVGLRGRLRYGEALNPDGTLYNVNYRSADSLDTYVTGPGVNEWEAHFTFHGFRYVQVEVFSIEGYGIADMEMEAVVLMSDMPRTGEFECGSEPVNQLFRNIRNSMQGNFFEVPMDCPQRDERLGWSGDAHFFMRTAMFLADTRLFYRKYLHDLNITQRDDGAICSVAPAIPGFQYGSASWADALPIMAWELYCQSGDRTIVEEHYPAIKRYLAYQKASSEHLILAGHIDHLSLAASPVDSRLIGTVFFLNTAVITASMAAVLNLPDEAEQFRGLSRQIRAAIRETFLDENGVLHEKTQSGFALLFYFDIFDNSGERKMNAVFFKELIVRNNKKLDTGFVGTAYLCPALFKAGLSSLACDLLLQREYPSWLYEVEHGATSIWERWNSYHPEKGFANPLMNSFNHYANGAVGEFLFTYLAGIRFCAVTDDVVRPCIEFHIVPDARIGPVRASLQTPCGLASSEWTIIGNQLRWICTVPPNATGHLTEYHIENLLPGTYGFMLNLDEGTVARMDTVLSLS